jgi:hypothetical protein
MPPKVITTGMEEPTNGSEGVCCRPEVPLKPITWWTTIDQVIQVVQTSSGPRLEVVDLQLTSSLAFVNTAVTAALIVAAAHLGTPILLSHRL